MNDTALIKLIRRSPDKGLSALMDDYLGLVHSIIRGRLQDPSFRQDVEEAVADTFTEFYRSIDLYDLSKGSVKGYICTIARRRAAQVYKRRLRDGSPLSLDEAGAENRPADAASFDEELIRGEQKHALFSAINDLGDPDREIVIRKYYFEEPSKSIAQRLGMSVSAVDTRTHRALKKLRTVLGGQEQ
ncbi:MAG: sigma-70 family RNA polymerase sigma factor [Clostridia bacterium]|nr:sigma-70 family RNA polymerase sigma factor [Clostridia bacterium]